MTRFSSIQALAALCLLFGVVGCGGGVVGPQAVVKGAVKLDGVPLESAEIRFVPQGNNLSLGTAAVATAADGTFTIKADPQNNNVLRPGKYLVLVSKVVSTDPAGGMGTPTKNLVPAQYAIQHQTPIKDVELKDGENTLPAFEIVSTKK